MRWVLVYDLAANAARIVAMQRVSRGDGDLGLSPEPALVGSPEWWQTIDRGELPVTVIEGTIRNVYWASMGDWPEFELDADDGSRLRFTREGDVSRYVPGLRVRLVYVMHPQKRPSVMNGDASQVVVRIEIEDSDERSDPRAPGPGGVGLRMAQQRDRKAFLVFLEHFLRGEVESEEWERVIVTHYFDEPLEHIRRECVRLRMRNEAMRWSPEERSQIEEWTRELSRASFDR